MADPELGSNLAPGEDGNTNTSPSADKKKRDAGKKHWFLTLKWPHGDNLTYIRRLEEWLQLHMTRYVFQREIGEETGYDHVHIQCSFKGKTKQRYEWFKLHLSPLVNCEVTRNIEQAYAYAGKDETRLAGPWIYPAPPTAGIRDEMDYVPYKWWQAEVKNILDGPVCDRTIHWYYDELGSCGKTTFIRHLMIHYDVAYFQGGKKGDIAYSWKGQRICLFNYSRQLEGHVSYDAIESLKDGLIFSNKFESNVKFYERPHVLVFANWQPDELALSADRLRVTQVD